MKTGFDLSSHQGAVNWRKIESGFAMIRAGWSWYTGAAGWYWQVAVQELLGLKISEGRLAVEPNLPPDWPGYEAVWRLPKGELTICVKRAGSYSAKLDGKPVREGVPLAELKGTHRLEITV